MAMQNSGGGIGIGGVSSWMQNNLHWLDDDDEQDSDTDSKLSGSAAADSVMLVDVLNRRVFLLFGLNRSYSMN